MAETRQDLISIEEWKIISLQSTHSEILEQWREFEEPQTTKYFLHLEKNKQVALLLDLSTLEQETLISNLANKDMKELLKDIPPDDLVDIFQQVSPEVRQSVWANLSADIKKIANFLLRFDYDDAAGIMTPHYVKVRANITVAQTITFIRKHIDEVETIYYIYIVDVIDRLQGVVSLRDIFRKKDNVLLNEFMITNIYTVNEDTDQEDVATLLQTHDLLAVPVVDNFNRLLGIVTVDDVIQVLNEEHDEDVLKMGAISSGNKQRPKSYLETHIFSLFKSRIPWLAVLLVTGTLTTNVINAFTPMILTATYLVLFIPVITSTGGNTATQSTALMIRGLSRNEITVSDFKEIFKIILKEIIVAIFLGISLAIIMFLRGLIFMSIMSILEIVIVSTALIFVVVFSALIGVLAPLTIARFGSDPTVIASPLIATLIDLIGLTIYFSIARLLLHM